MGTYDPRVVWQFWGRAAEASLDRNRSGALFLLSLIALRELLTGRRHYTNMNDRAGSLLGWGAP